MVNVYKNNSKRRKVKAAWVAADCGLKTVVFFVNVKYAFCKRQHFLYLQCLYSIWQTSKWSLVSKDVRYDQ